MTIEENEVVEENRECQELLQKNGNIVCNLPNTIGEHRKNSSSKKSTKNTTKTRSKYIKARTVLWYLSFCGFAINYMQRVNLNIAIVGMIKHTTNKESHLTPAAASCLNSSGLLTEMVQNITLSNGTETFNNSRSIREATNKTEIDTESKFILSPERYILDLFQINYDKNGFEWDEYVLGLILGSFFWLHWLLQVPGGVLARIYGTKLIFGVGNLVGCLLCGLIPIAAYLDYKYIIGLRVLQGLICGGMWPSMHNMVSKWIPPNERSTFLSSYNGSSIGVSIFFPLFGYVMQIFSWECVFHICTLVGLVWFLCWQYFVYDSPAEHPRIDPEERAYIEDSLAETVDSTNKLPTPWADILKSCTVWANIISLFGGAWVFYILMTQAPIYFAVIHGWNVKMAGFLSGLPHFTRVVFAYGFSVACDWALKTNKLKTNQVRILALWVCNGVAGLFTLVLAYSGCNSILAIVSFAGAITVSGTVTTGPFASIVDMSPNFSSILFGFGIMVAILPGFITPIIVGKLTLNNQTVEQWRYVYLISAAVGVGTSIVYMTFSDSSVQPWNYGKGKLYKLQNMEENTKKPESNTSDQESTTK